ncbi:MAG TPA: hypothetical protein VLI90_04335, partial [Tepidisphaeraceae bacterium]|nr:hypothetical protein [Tepidisphaeraceae bacterium]
NAGTPAGVVIVGGAMADSSLNSSVPIRVMRVASWSDTANNSSISAPLIATLISLGGFNAALNLSGSGSALPTLGVAQVVGAIGGDSWAINGRANTIVAGSITSAWSGTLAGLLNVIVDRGGSFASNLSAGGIGTMLVIGDVNGGAAITAASANVIRVTGSVANSTITMNGPASATPSLRAMIVGNAITGSTIATAGDLTALIASSLAGSTITAGVDGGVTTIDAVTPGNIGSHAIRSLRLTARTAGAFAGSTVIAHTITTAALGDVNTNNNGTPEGVAAVAFTSLTATVGGIRVAPSRTQLQDAGQLSAYFSDKGVNLGDFRVDIVT